jgi:hypothetical protein
MIVSYTLKRRANPQEEIRARISFATARDARDALDLARLSLARQYPEHVIHHMATVQPG